MPNEKITKRAYVRWSPTEDQVLIIRLNKGESIEAVAQQHQRSSNAIRCRIALLIEQKQISLTQRTVEEEE